MGFGIGDRGEMPGEVRLFFERERERGRSGWEIWVCGLWFVDVIVHTVFVHVISCVWCGFGGKIMVSHGLMMEWEGFHVHVRLRILIATGGGRMWRWWSL